MGNRNASPEQPRGTSIFVKALAFAMPSIGIALLMVPVVTVLGGIYAKNFGLTLTTIASVMLVARVFDAVTDPIIGYCSDRWRMRTGSRKSFMLIGVILLVPCSYFLFVPGGTVSAAYFTFWYLAFYLSLTIFAIPQLAWINEFTTDSKEKTLVFSVMAIVGMVGSAMFYAIPLFPFFASTEITPQILKVTVIVGAVFLIPGLLLALKVVPDGPAPEPVPTAHCENQQSITMQLIAVLKAMVGNRPFVLFVMTFMCLGIGSGMWMGMFFIYVDSYLKLGEEFAKISLWGMGIGAVAVPIWYRFSLYFGKRKAWLTGMTILTGVFFCTSLLSPKGSGFNELFVLNMLMVFGNGSMAVIAGPMLCDAIDYGRLKDHVERNAVYFSIFSLLTKMQSAIGGALGMGIAGWYGFDVMASEQSASGLVGLHLGVAWLPALFVAMAMVFIGFMPLTEGRMVVIRKRLAARDRHLAERVKTVTENDLVLVRQPA
ncbi:MFS transporter [Porticoccaceae bacterium]|nr:MFS transporter [Porticoccaceae bacterium]